MHSRYSHPIVLTMVLLSSAIAIVGLVLLSYGVGEIILASAAPGYQPVGEWQWPVLIAGWFWCTLFSVGVVGTVMNLVYALRYRTKPLSIECTHIFCEGDESDEYRRETEEWLRRSMYDLSRTSSLYT